MALQARMADSVQPHLIPGLYAHDPNGVAAYEDGRYAWNPVVRGFPNHWRICVTGDPAVAPRARVIDVEKFDATPADVAAYQTVRARLGENTVVYCSRSTVPEVVRVNVGYPSLHWWIATLEDKWYTPTDLAAYLQRVWSVDINPNRIVAIQWAGRGSYDESSIWGDPHWTKSPH
jgi:hypothetical protein